MVKPSQRREMAQAAVANRRQRKTVVLRISDLVKRATDIRPKLSSENALIADWLIRLTHNQRNWGFGLCYLYLRNVKGFRWNHKRVYRIYREAGA